VTGADVTRRDTHRPFFPGAHFTPILITAVFYEGDYFIVEGSNPLGQIFCTLIHDYSP
jgi:hypothetical protein